MIRGGSRVGSYPCEDEGLVNYSCYMPPIMLFFYKKRGNIQLCCFSCYFIKERKTATGGNRRKSLVWCSSTGKSVSPRSSLSVGDGGAGMPSRLVGGSHCHNIVVTYRNSGLL